VSARRPLGDLLTDRIVGQEATAFADPVQWAEAVLGITFWSAQVEIARALLEHRHVAVKAAHAVGKSKLVAAIMAWWIAGSGRPLGDAFCISTAPTSAQLSAVVWRELGRCHRSGRLPGRITGGQVPTWMVDGELVAMGRKPADLTDPEAASSSFQGIHAKWPLAVIDEAGGCPGWVFDACEAVATSAASRVIAIGNPTSRDSRFAEICKPGSGWHVITVPAESTPAFTGEPVPATLLDLLVSRRWVEERRQRWGPDSPLYRSRVEAQFPQADDDALIDPAHVEAAQALELPARGPVTFGVDVARSGNDRTVIYRRQGGQLRRVHVAHGADLMQTSGKVAALLIEAGDEASAVIDTIGLGAGVFDRLREQGLPAVPFNASERARDPKRYRNARAEAYWRLREALAAGQVDLDPGDDELAGELVAQKWTVDSAGRVQIGSKAEQAKSPDHADAAMMALGPARNLMPGDPARGRGGEGLPGDQSGDRFRRLLDGIGTPIRGQDLTSDLLDEKRW
jgi:hypothetical protein